MQADEVKSRFGRCPYCRAMIYQDLTAVIFYCSKCRTPIRGKNPRPADETEYALAQLEILSADTASVFSDDVEPPNPRSAWAVNDDDARPPLASRSATTGRSFDPIRQQGTGDASSSSLPYRQRRTRRSSSGDVDLRSDAGSGSGTESDSDMPAPATSYRRRASPLSSQELEVASVLSGFEPSININKSPLSDPAFQKDLLQALDNLRKLIAAVDHSASCNANADVDGGGKPTITRRSSRLMRRLESQLTQALPVERPRRNASTSSASSSRRGGLKRQAHHCRQLLGGTPFVVCGECSEILQLPATGLTAGRAVRVKCGGCGEAFELTLPVSGSTNDRPNRIFSAPQPVADGGGAAEDGEQPRPVGPLHRVLGYSSVSSVLRRRRYGEHD
ncbi:hypothetical protein HU200_025940 [Digitaria exilis]|uniref:Probable zinc-ribbon domain-containing protein n=1 Tax=Digitaria exilis TaxID=1010633 RepID=A0A835EUP5_9POAL|nr:hypothetical protein HU200_025940 [Digitaria exilis]